MGESSKKMKKKMEHWEVVTMMLMVYDFLAVTVSYFAALWIRFDCRFSMIDDKYLQAYYRTILVYAGFCIVVFWFLRLYKSIWRFASYAEIQRVIYPFLIKARRATFLESFVKYFCEKR